MIARNEQKLQQRVKEIKEVSQVEVKYVIADFGKGMSAQFYEDIFKEIKDLDVSILMNNVGLNMEYLHEEPSQKVLEFLTINCVPQTMMTKLFLDQFRNRKTQCAVISLSSVSYFVEFIGYNPLYNATKMFNRAFSACMDETYERDGIDFLCIKPGQTITNFNFGGGKSFKELSKGKRSFWTDFRLLPQEVAQGILTSLGNVNEGFGGHAVAAVMVEGFIWLSHAFWVQRVARFFGVDIKGKMQKDIDEKIKKME